MKKIKINKSLFKKMLALSCIENYLLYILISEQQDIRYIYSQSFINFSWIINAFCDENISYAYFDKIPRLQETAANKKIIIQTITPDINNAVLNHEYCCAQVKTEYITKRYNRNFWRDDHYLLLCEYIDNSYTFLNDTPCDVFTVDKEELLNLYAGKSICFDMKTTFNKNIEENLLKSFKQSIFYPAKAQEIFVDNIIKARDILGVLKISRKRIYEYCSMYIDVNFMIEYLTVLEHKYSVIEYMRLRNNYDLNIVNKSLQFIQSQDLIILEILRKRIEPI